MRECWKVKVSGLKEGTNSIRFEMSPEDVDIRGNRGQPPSFPQGNWGVVPRFPQLTLTRDVIAELELLKQGSRVYISGKVNFQAEMTCSVCAEPFRKESTESLYVEFERGLPSAAGNVHELGEDDLIRSFYSNDELNIMPVIRDTILLSIPIAPQCRPDCKGVCLECGENLNLGDCACCKTAAVSSQ